MKVAFLHPDLGIGGAERLIVDAAVGLQNEGHKVTIFTSHCDKTHCFEEVSDGTLKLEVAGDFLPQELLGRFKIIFAGLRQLILILTMVINGSISEYDFFIVDQLSFCLPLLHLFHEQHARILFYCHFPDQKLAVRSSLIKSIYRFPFDFYEQLSMTAADSVVVNSEFTKSVYDETFPLLKTTKVPGIIYPCVNLKKEEISNETNKIIDELINSNEFFLSINRFEKKKEIELAIKSFDLFLKDTKNINIKLIITGGYDNQLVENKEYLEYLEKLSDELSLNHLTLFSNDYTKISKINDLNSYKIIFLPSISSNLKEALLSKTRLLLYTPSFEHFGIVPLEAMKFGKPVLAINNGGPKETIISLDKDPKNGTGWLVENDPVKWSSKLRESLDLDNEIILKNSTNQVNSKFTSLVMTQSFEKAMLYTLKKPYISYIWEKFIHLWKIPVFFYLYRNFLPLYSYAIIVILFFPPSIYQFLGFLGVTILYIVEPKWFEKRW